MIQYADIVYDTIVDGIGLRNTLYVCGCPHNCEGCHNKALQHYNYGNKVSFFEIANLLRQNDNDITISGGEPFEQPAKLSEMIELIKKLDKNAGIPKRNIWIYSGYTFEQMVFNPIKKKLLEHCDVLVDGKFETDKRSLDLKFRGSSNQRIIDIQKSLEENKIVELSFERDEFNPKPKYNPRREV